MLRCLSLSLIEAAGDLSCSVHLLLVLNAKREEIYTFSGLLGSRSRSQQRSIAVMHQNRAICLGAHSSDIHGELPSAKVHAVCLIGPYERLGKRTESCFHVFSFLKIICNLTFCHSELILHL